VLVGSHGLGRIHHLLDGGHRRITILVGASMAMNPVRHVRLDLQDIGSPVWTRFELSPPSWPSDRTRGRALFSERSERTADVCPRQAPSLDTSRTRQRARLTSDWLVGQPESVNAARPRRSCLPERRFEASVREAHISFPTQARASLRPIHE
jgi:hypothetical protein